MNCLIVFAHPEPASFNGALKDVAVHELERMGHAVAVSDLYRMGWNPALGPDDFGGERADADYLDLSREQERAFATHAHSADVTAEQAKVTEADLVLFQFPVWWFSMPAILKGWVDRVFAMGRTYGGDRIYTNGVFKGKRALLSLTTGGPASAYVKGAFNGDIQAILRPVQRGMLQFVGFDVLAPQITYGPVRLEQDARVERLAAYAERLKNIASEKPCDVGIY